MIQYYTNDGYYYTVVIGGEKLVYFVTKEELKKIIRVKEENIKWKKIK